MKEIEVLENIKKQEDSSDKKIKNAQDRAARMLDESKKNAQLTLDKAKSTSEKYYNNLMDKARDSSKEQREDLLNEAKKKSQGLKPVDKATILKIFQKAVKERFGV